MSDSLPRGIRNNNPGNIRRNNTPWEGLAANQTDSAFFQFTDAKWGLRAILKIITSYEARGLTTVRGWITSWAPPSDSNDTDAYIASVAGALGVGPDDTVSIQDAGTATGVMSAITKQENGQMPYAQAVFDAAFSLAFPVTV